MSRWPRRRRKSRRDDEPLEVHPLGGVLREVLSEPALRRGLAAGRLAQAWQEVVGGELARHTAPRSLSDGGLVVAVSSSGWAAQVRFLSEEIRNRANAVLGEELVRKVVVTVFENR
ncbi:MAG: DUF721 domain-containing protein [Actinomycetota bacterium]